MGVTVDGVPWAEARSFGPDGPTNQELNTDALAPASLAAGYCLCLHPMMSMILFTGFACNFCDQPVTAESTSPEAKTLRTQAILAVYPHLKRKED